MHSLLISPLVRRLVGILPLLCIYLQAVGADTIQHTEGSIALNSSRSHQYSSETILNLILFSTRRKGNEKMLLNLLAQKGEF